MCFDCPFPSFDDEKQGTTCGNGDVQSHGQEETKFNSIIFPLTGVHTLMDCSYTYECRFKLIRMM